MRVRKPASKSLALILVLASVAATSCRRRPSPPPASPAPSAIAHGAARPRVIVVGGGIAGLVSAYELGKRGVTLMLVWEEYRQQHRGGYSYSQFRRHFLDHTSASPEPRMRREHAPGAACEVDYAGMTLTISTTEGPRQASVGLAPAWATSS